MTSIRELYGISEEKVRDIATALATIELMWGGEENAAQHIFDDIQAIEDKVTREIALITFFVKKFKNV